MVQPAGRAVKCRSRALSGRVEGCVRAFTATQTGASQCFTRATTRCRRVGGAAVKVCGGRSGWEVADRP